jgi:Di-haem oxidoreductase, putative peroxidase
MHMDSKTPWSAATLGPLLLLTAMSPGCRRAPEAARPAAAAAPRTLPAIELGDRPAFPLSAHVESSDLAAGRYTFERLFDDGRRLFHTNFNGLDGVGVALAPGGVHVARFAPLGPKGPNSQSCAECHNTPVAASAGLAHGSVVRDPAGKGTPPFNVRSVTSLFGDGILQMLAEEMTEELQAARDEALAAAKAAPGTTVSRDLKSKGTSFGSIGARATPGGTVTLDVSRVVGVDPDLVVRPMGWKGDIPTVRDVTAGAAARAMGMLGEEIVWKQPGGDQHPDLDGDGVTRELSVGDITAITVYTAAQETPTDLARLGALGYVRPPTAEQSAQIEAGRKEFMDIGCASCHTPEMTLVHTRFEEPTARGNGSYYDHALAKHDAGYDPRRPFSFDILKEAQPPRAEARREGGATIRLFGDLKRHAMGRVLADPGGTDPAFDAALEPLKYEGKLVKVAADQFLTAELWGVGNTGPWLHDNRAGTLREAILLHGEDTPPPPGQPGRSEAQEARDAFKARPKTDQDAVVAFLSSLRTFSPETN